MDKLVYNDSDSNSDQGAIEDYYGDLSAMASYSEKEAVVN